MSVSSQPDPVAKNAEHRFQLQELCCLAASSSFAQEDDTEAQGVTRDWLKSLRELATQEWQGRGHPKATTKDVYISLWCVLWSSECDLVLSPSFTEAAWMWLWVVTHSLGTETHSLGTDCSATKPGCWKRVQPGLRTKPPSPPPCPTPLPIPPSNNS